MRQDGSPWSLSSRRRLPSNQRLPHGRDRYRDTSLSQGYEPVADTPARLPDSGSRIAFSDNAEKYLEQLGVDLITGRVELWQLPPSLLQFWEFAYQQGARSRQEEIDRANADADRYYAHLYNPQETLKPGIPLRELERIRDRIYNSTSPNDSARRTI